MRKQIIKDGKVIAEKQEESASDMLDFLEKARNGELLPPEVIIQYANLLPGRLDSGQYAANAAYQHVQVHEYSSIWGRRILEISVATQDTNTERRRPANIVGRN